MIKIKLYGSLLREIGFLPLEPRHSRSEANAFARSIVHQGLFVNFMGNQSGDSAGKGQLILSWPDLF
jgi:hypothetical protein